MGKWKIDKIPEHTLSIKYLRKILTPKQYETLIKRYMDEKKKTNETRIRNANTAKEPEK